MKQKHIIIGLLAALGTSCNHHEIIESSSNESIVQVTAGIGNSRVIFSEGEDMTYIASWENGDAITLNTPKQANLNYTAALSESGVTTFSPEGKALKDIEGDTVYACYPASPIIDGVVELPQTNKWSDKEHLPFAYAINNIQNSKVNLQFKHVFAFLKLTLTAEALENAITTDGDKSISSIMLQSTSKTLGVVSGSFNFNDQIVAINEASNEIRLTIEGEQSSEITSRSFYIPILPQEANTSINIVALHQNEANCDTLASINKTTPSEGLLAGNVYSLTIGANNATMIEGEEGYIHLETSGTLSNFIADTNKYNIKKLKISGPLNGDDIKYLREMAGRDVYGDKTEGQLTELNLSEASIVEGGDYYYAGGDNVSSFHYTQNNVFGDYFFYNTNISKIILPNSIVEIGEASLRRLELEELVIPDKVISIGKSAFSYNNFREIIIPDNVEQLGEGAFTMCTLLKNVSIGINIKKIEHSTFSGCSNLETISWPNTIDSIGSSAFSGCNNLIEIDFPDSLKSIGYSAFYGCDNLKSLNLPDGVTTIENQAFQRCINLRTASLGNSLITLGGQAFDGCGGLKEITFPNSLQVIGTWAFRGCHSLLKIIGGDGVVSIAEEAFGGCKNLVDFKLSSQLTDIGYHAFSGCTSWASDIVIPETMEVVSWGVFSGCSSLTNITILEGVSVIAVDAFRGCNIKEITIPNSVVSIRYSAFEDCSSLKTVKVGTGVETIEYAFDGVPITEFYCYATTPPEITSLYKNNPKIDKDAKLYVPLESLTAYQESKWAEYFNNIIAIEQ